MVKQRIFRFIFSICLLCFSGLTLKAQDLKPSDWPNLVGYWKFQDATDLIKATVGNKLILKGSHSVVSGPAYGDTAIRIGIGSYYEYAHGIASNGGGDSVNQYTLMFDFKILNLNKWHTFFQTDTTNANDGECFIRPNTSSRPGRIGTATTGYTEDSIFPNQWYRLVVSVNLDHYYRYYINGALMLDGDTQYVDDRFALTPKILFFADNNQEDDVIDIASIAIFDTCLSSSDIAKIGTIEPCIANPPVFDLGNDTSLCSNQSLNLGAGLGYSKYEWSIGGSTPFLLIESSKLGLGQKTIWQKVTDRNGCTWTDTMVINFMATPKVNLGADTAICEGQFVELTGGTDTSQKYLWKSMPSGRVLSTKNSITVDSTGRYILIITSSEGCVNTDTIGLTVNKNPSKPVITISGKTSFCDGDSVQFEGPDGYADYLWSKKSGNSLHYIKSGQIVTLQVKDSNGCVSPLSNSVGVVVFPLPDLPELVVIGDTVLCAGDSVILKAPEGYVEYEWRDSQGDLSRTILNEGDYAVSVIDTNACASEFSEIVHVSTLSRPGKPVVNLAGENTFCKGDSVLLSVFGNFASYLWSDSSVLKERLIHQTGDYQVKVTNDVGCESPWSEAINILVNSYPSKPTILVGTSDSLICNMSGDHYRWFKGSSLLLDSNKVIPTSGSGYFTVQAGNGDCWSELSDSMYFQRSDIKSYTENPTFFRIVPNPVMSEMKLWFEGRVPAGEISIQILNSSGLKVFEVKTHLNNNPMVLPLSAETLAPGIYFIRVFMPGESWIGKVEKL